MGAGSWQQEVADALLAEGVKTVAIVPDGRLDAVQAALAQGGCTVRTLTREDECIGYAAGRAMAGDLTPVLMQCSGLGNALNTLGSLVIPYGIGVPLVISMRGTLGERNPSQIPIGRATRALLESLGIPAYSIRTREQIPHTISGMLSNVSGGLLTAAVLLEPELGMAA